MQKCECEPLRIPHLGVVPERAAAAVGPAGKCAFEFLRADDPTRRQLVRRVDLPVAVESDSGVFEPASLGFSGSTAAQALVRDIGTLLTPIGLQEITGGGGGADIGPIARAGGVPMLAYLGNPARYFAIHHTPADTLERIVPEEVSRATAALAVMAYVAAEMPERLPR